MSAKRNKPTDVFRYIDMQTGPEWKNPQTGEVSRCWPWKGALNDQGRPFFSLNGKKVIAYRLTYELATGDTLGDRMWRHHCDNPACCNPSHGVPGTNVDNMDDMKQRGRHGLPHHAVRYIKKLIRQGVHDATIAELYGTGVSTIKDIRLGVTYGHVKEEEAANVPSDVQTKKDAGATDAELQEDQ
jgi:hypothetical protein